MRGGCRTWLKVSTVYAQGEHLPFELCLVDYILVLPTNTAHRGGGGRDQRRGGGSGGGAGPIARRIEYIEDGGRGRGAPPPPAPATTLPSNVKLVEGEFSVNREKTVPCLVRMFPTAHRHREDTVYYNGLPKAEVQVYTWLDCTLRELADLLKQVPVKLCLACACLYEFSTHGQNI